MLLIPIELLEKLEPLDLLPLLELLDEELPLEDFLRQVIEAALRRHEGNVSRAATALGMTRRALQYRMSRDGIRA